MIDDLTNDGPSPLTDDSPCPINGKYHNVPMGGVSARFLDWFLEQPHLMRKYPMVVNYCAMSKRAIYRDLNKKSDKREGRMLSYDPDYDDDNAWETAF